jgi:hypothetical protein
MSYKVRVERYDEVPTTYSVSEVRNTDGVFTLYATPGTWLARFPHSAVSAITRVDDEEVA